MENDKTLSSEVYAQQPENVISMEAFRISIRQSEEALFTEVLNPYQPADYLTFLSAKRSLEMLNSTATPGILVVVSRFVTGHTTSVNAAREPDVGWAYSVSRSVKDFESLTLDLETYDEHKSRILFGQIDRLFTTALIAHHVISRESRAVYDKPISLPMLGNEIFRTIAGKQAERITEWRAASALGIVAMSEQRSKLGVEISKYLKVVLARRVDYTLNKEFVESLLGHSLEEEVDISDFLIGFCNPLSPFELQQVVPSVKLIKPL